jgi:DNA modification methylase
MSDFKMVDHMERRPVDQLRAYPGNARTHSDEQIRQIAASISEFGFVNPILIAPDNMIIAGHARLAAARLLGFTDVPVFVLDHLTAAQQRALVLADNQLALTAGWDEELLRAELKALKDCEFDVAVLGFDDEELTRLLADNESVEALTDEDDTPALLPEPISVTGDLWVLGKHRLLCGDATVLTDVERLMAGDAVDLVFTDPPYNVDYQGYTDQHLRIQGDRMPADQFQRFLADLCGSYRIAVKPMASLYVCHPSLWQREFQTALEAAGFEIRCQIIWAKNTFAWGFGRYKFQHEPIFYCHVAGQKDAWYGDKSQSTLWEEKKPAANRIHPTAKPVELVERALVNSSKPGDLVADLFGGSGSTLIACERRGRQARVMEIDPKYVDCIIRRWQDHTGKQATLESDGSSFTEAIKMRLKPAA